MRLTGVVLAYLRCSINEIEVNQTSTLRFTPNLNHRFICEV